MEIFFLTTLSENGSLLADSAGKYPNIFSREIEVMTYLYPKITEKNLQNCPKRWYVGWVEGFFTAWNVNEIYHISVSIMPSQRELRFVAGLNILCVCVCHFTCKFKVTFLLFFMIQNQLKKHAQFNCLLFQCYYMTQFDIVMTSFIDFIAWNHLS